MAPACVSRQILTTLLASEATLTIEHPEHTARLSVSGSIDGRESEISVLVMIGPHNFQKGIPSKLQVALVLVNAANRQQQFEQFLLPVPDTLSPADWPAQFELHEQAVERISPLGQTLNLGMVQGTPLRFKVAPLLPGHPPSRQE